MKTVLALLCLSALALGSPLDHHHGSYKIPPKPFAYNYGVQDDYTGTVFDKSETQDEYGSVNGEYRVHLPDGRIQIVKYHADHEGGFVADVQYEGTPSYPPPPKGGYGHI
eukprot:TRINITY_DN1659_c0_g1_i1.p2 TRINITY_DN1659_c0_g1~~TRINITY_DN1659_c0_g1_i1.p2  ORF type:complete len:110 (+),score=33.19 TRINITY_DN1659_c0_g1_i1:146-475(+)